MNIFDFLFFSSYLQGESAHRQYHDISLSHPAKDFTQPPTVIFMGRQTSRGSDAESGTTSVHLHQALHRSPNRSVHSRERLPSGLLKDFRVSGEDAASNRAHLSDDISGSNDSPDGCNLSDKHERTMAVLPAGNVPFGSDDEREPSPVVTLTRPEMKPTPSSSSSRSSSPIRAENPPVEHTDSQEVAHQPPVMEDAERERETTFGKQSQETAGLKCYSSLTYLVLSTVIVFMFFHKNHSRKHFEDLI